MIMQLFEPQASIQSDKLLEGFLFGMPDNIGKSLVSADKGFKVKYWHMPI